MQTCNNLQAVLAWAEGTTTPGKTQENNYVTRVRGSRPQPLRPSRLDPRKHETLLAHPLFEGCGLGLKILKNPLTPCSWCRMEN